MIALLTTSPNPQVVPLWLENEADAAPGGPWGWLIWGGAVAAVLVLFAAWATLRAERLRRDPGSHALRAVARRLGADRVLLRELEALAEADAGTSVLCMLISDHALRRAVQASGRPPTARVVRLMAARGADLPPAERAGHGGSRPMNSGGSEPRARSGR
ncbi:MAG: hypothetical protein DYG92_11110 [Leptolyngbya sp. PLA1]|nr:hypothetical protein [Leptolyngbya sp. PLA1]